MSTRPWRHASITGTTGPSTVRQLPFSGDAYRENTRIHKEYTFSQVLVHVKRSAARSDSFRQADRLKLFSNPELTTSSNGVLSANLLRVVTCVCVPGISVHRLPNGTYALFYMGAEQPGLKAHPNCTPGSGDSKANATTGSHNGRRIGCVADPNVNPLGRTTAMHYVAATYHKLASMQQVSMWAAIHRPWSMLVSISRNVAGLTDACSCVFHAVVLRIPCCCHLSRIATAASLDGPWRRLDAALFGPDPQAWDNIDVSNPSPIIHQDGSVIMMYASRMATL